MDTLLTIYVIGFVAAFILNAATFLSNVKVTNTHDLDLSDKTITAIMSVVGAFFSWLFIIVYILSLKNSYLALKVKAIFNYQPSKNE
jgi:hypothetical protein